MPRLETEDAVEKAKDALKAFYAAKKIVEKAQSALHERVSVLKNITGLSHNDATKIEEEVLLMLGRVAVEGLPETR